MKRLIIFAILTLGIAAVMTSCEQSDISQPTSNETTTETTISTATEITSYTNNSTATVTVATTTTESEYAGETMHGPDNYVPKYRSLFYSMPYMFSDYVGDDNYLAWSAEYGETHLSEDDPYIIGFIQHFNISKEKFTELNEEWKARVIELGWDPESEAGEAYNVDIIYTFDVKTIQDYYLRVD